MKITNVDSFIEEFRNGRNIWSKASIELVVREIERLRKENHKLATRLAALDSDLVLFEVSEMLKKTQARVRELEDANRWIPVGERLPDDTRVYDVAIAGYRYSWTGSCVFGKWIGESGKALLGITHWKYRPELPIMRENLPLPQLPAEEE